MKKLLLSFTAILAFASISKAQIYLGKEGFVKFFSETVVKDVEAINKAAKPIMDTKAGTIAFKLSNRSFKFDNATMEEHFNDQYMESEKYPMTTFSGKIQETIDYTKDGVNKVNVKGTMDMHGVKKEITIPGTITIKGGQIIIDAKFKVSCTDYKIKVPANIAETLDVTVQCTLEAFKK